MQPAKFFAHNQFSNPRTRAVFAGLAAHSFLSLEAPLSAAIGIVLAVTVHAVGWPIPERGAQSITNALTACLEQLRGTIHTSRKITSLSELPDATTLCDIAPQQLSRIAGSRLTPSYKNTSPNSSRALPHSKSITRSPTQSPGAPPIAARQPQCTWAEPWKKSPIQKRKCPRGESPSGPLVLLAQPSLFDATRAPAGKHTAWAYCHVPNG